MHIEELDETRANGAVRLWGDVGLTRPWNDPQEDFLRALRGPTSSVLGAVEEDELVGTVLVGEDGHRGWIYYLAVAPAYQRRGVGRALVHHAEEWLRDRGVVKIQLMVRDTNLDVANFYLRLGYEDARTTVLAKWLVPAA